MKNFQLIVALCGIVICAKSAQPVNQEIRYEANEANEVYLVWGVNDWQTLEKKELPEGSYIKDKLMYTLMTEKENGFFSVNLKVKQGTVIDFVFRITKGPHDVPSDIWDVNSALQKDYHTLAFNDNTTLITSHIVIKPKQQLSVLNYAWPILFIVIIIATAFFILKRYRFKDLSLKPGPRKIIISSAGIVLFVLFMIRASVSLLGWNLYYHPFEFMPQLLWAGFYDYIYVVFITLLFILLLFFFRTCPRVQKSIVYLFLTVGLISVVAAILNIRIVEMIGKPFNFRWFYYSGFLNSSDSKAAMASNVSLPYILNIMAVCLAMVIAGVMVIYALEFFLQKYKLRKVLLITFVCLNVGYAIIAQNVLKIGKWDYNKLANPVIAFLESVNPFICNPELYTMEVPDSLQTFGKVKENSFEFPAGFSKKIKNLIVLVLESTPAEYIQPYDQKFKVTPELEKYLSNSIVFDNVYAHSPATNKSMVSLLGSVYPWLSYTSITQEHPCIRIPSISSELKKRGYRTAFFNSGDNRFQKANEFLSQRKLDEIKDCKTLSCKKQFEEKDNNWDPLDGMNDECTGDALLSWVKQKNNNPFFAMMWTYQTHYPYYASGPEKNYAIYDPILNRYLNAVNHSDFVLGKILGELKRSGLFMSTLVVVVGDHGEAFGRHNQTTHASNIYEENLHVPLIFINPAFNGERKKEIGGMVDVAPTIMAIMGNAAAEKWQGQNLFVPSKNKRTYFFCPWSDYLFGYREGDKKYIYNATKDITEMYDLKKDPGETCNLASAAEIKICHQKLAAWIQYQNKFMSEVLKPTSK